MSEIGYTPKNLLFDEDGRDKLFKGISTIANAVKSTLGPRVPKSHTRNHSN